MNELIYINKSSKNVWPYCVFSYHNCHFFSLVALHTAAKKPDRQFNCIFFRSRISERNSISFCCLRDSKLGSRQINHFLAKNKKMQLLESFLPNSIVYLIFKSRSESKKSIFRSHALRSHSF